MAPIDGQGPRSRPPCLTGIEGLATLPQRRFLESTSVAVWERDTIWRPEMAGLLDLPPEIVLYILKHLDVSGLYAAIRSHSIFNSSWKSHNRLISAAVLSNSIESYPEAFQLEQAAHSEIPTDFQAVVRQNKRMMDAARCVSNIYELYLEDYVRPWLLSRKHHKLTGKNRRAFKRAFYWYWKAVLTAQYKPFRALKPLDQLSPRAVLSLCELLLWVASKSFSCLYGPIARTQRIYGRLYNRPRLSAHRKWQICTDNLWDDPDFKTVRRKAWRKILGPDDPERPEPVRGSSTVYFLGEMRKTLQARPKDSF